MKPGTADRIPVIKLLVAGGAGHPGLVVTAQLLDAGHEVIVLDDRPQRIGMPSRLRPRSLRPRCLLREGRSLQHVGVADHAVTLKAPWTGSG